MCQAAHQASTGKNNLTTTKKTIYRHLVVCSQCPITTWKALDINIEARVKPPEVIWHQTITA